MAKSWERTGRFEKSREPSWDLGVWLLCFAFSGKQCPYNPQESMCIRMFGPGPELFGCPIDWINESACLSTGSRGGEAQASLSGLWDSPQATPPPRPHPLFPSHTSSHLQVLLPCWHASSNSDNTSFACGPWEVATVGGTGLTCPLCILFKLGPCFSLCPKMRQ